MIPRTILPTSITTLAHRQSGAVSTSQLAGHGISPKIARRMLADGTLTSLAQGIYAIGPANWRQSVWAAVLLGGQRSAIGGLAGAFILNLADTEPPIIDCYVGVDTYRHHDGPWRFIRADRKARGDLPVTLVDQTILDASRQLDDDAVIAMVTRARGRLRKGALENALAATGRHPKRALLLDLVKEVTAGTESPLEFRYQRDVELLHGLPVAKRQANPSGYARVDNLYESFGVIVELDGRKYHAGLAASGDAARDNAHLMLGLVTLRFDWPQVTRTPCAVAVQVAGALKMGGWKGEIKACTRCRSSSLQGFTP